MKRLKDEFERDCGEYARRLQSQGPEAGEDLKAACALVFEKAFLPPARKSSAFVASALPRARAIATNFPSQSWRSMNAL